MFLLVPAYAGCPGQTAIKWLLLLLLYAKEFVIYNKPHIDSSLAVAYHHKFHEQNRKQLMHIVC